MSELPADVQEAQKQFATIQHGYDTALDELVAQAMELCKGDIPDLVITAATVVKLGSTEGLDHKRLVGLLACAVTRMTRALYEGDWA